MLFFMKGQAGLRSEGMLFWLNGFLLTAVLLYTLAPTFGYNLAIYTPLHSHLYFGEVDVAHDHKGDTHPVQKERPEPLATYLQIQESIVFLPHNDVGNLGLFYVTLLMTVALLLYTNTHLQQSDGPHQLAVTLNFLPPELEPPRP